MSRAIYDIAIVGGGIAGCAAAIALAGGGRSAVMLAPPQDERDRFGEFLSPAANELLHKLGLAEAFRAGPHRPANATYTAWGSGSLVERNALMHVEGPGHVLDRPAFERLLRDAAERSGIAVLPKALDGAVHDGTMWSMQLVDGPEIAARFVLDCSGRTAVVARRYAVHRREDRLVAAGAFLRQRTDEVEPTPATLIEAVPEGWWYASLLPDRRLALVLFGDSDTLPRGLAHDTTAWRECVEATQYVRQWLDSAGFDSDVQPRLAGAATTWLDPVAGPGWAAAGDAAAAFDPLSSHGLTTALWGGRRAALAAVAALDGDAEPLESYAATVRRAVQDFLGQRQATYAREGRWPALPFWRRRHSR